MKLNTSKVMVRMKQISSAFTFFSLTVILIRVAKQNRMIAYILIATTAFKRFVMSFGAA